jgi:trk system potassium uptake protein TrkH
MVTLFGSLPFLFANAVPTFTDAFFESMSGFTTTGATVFTQIDAQPQSVLFWRCWIQWLGGMGIIVLFLAIFPLFGVGVLQLYRGEVPGPTPDRLVPKIGQTAKLLWVVYVILSGGELLLLWAGGMSFYDAVLHTFATMQVLAPTTVSILRWLSSSLCFWRAAILVCTLSPCGREAGCIGGIQSGAFTSA